MIQMALKKENRTEIMVSWTKKWKQIKIQIHYYNAMVQNKIN